jgi:mono/diheme cytochrome c family protein
MAVVAGCASAPSEARVQYETPTTAAHLVAVDDSAAERGEPIYERYCQTCHGARGDGRGVSGPNMSPRPRNFVAAVYKCRSTPNGALPLPGDIRRTVSEGMHASAMPGWRTLGDSQVFDAVEYVRSFSPRWRTEPVPPPMAIPADSGDDAPSIARGRAIYDRVQCGACHGAGGRGDGPAVASLRDDSGNPIVPFDFTGDRPLRCGSSPRDLYRTMIKGIDGTPMPSFAASLQPGELWDLVHFVMSLRR